MGLDKGWAKYFIFRFITIVGLVVFFVKQINERRKSFKSTPKLQLFNFNTLTFYITVESLLHISQITAFVMFQEKSSNQ